MADTELSIDYAECMRFFKVYGIVVDMLRDRGYYVEGEDIIDDFDIFKLKFDDGNIDIYVTDGNRGNYVHFHIQDKSFGKHDLINIVDMIMTDHSESQIHIDVIIKDERVNSAVNKLLETDSKYSDVIVFLEKKSFRCNITDHVLQPHIYLLSNEEKMEVLDKHVPDEDVSKASDELDEDASETDSNVASEDESEASETASNVTSNQSGGDDEIEEQIETKRDIILKYKTKASKFPKISATGPISKYFNAKPGDVFKFVGRSSTQKNRITYRMVR
jgi:DNA-directed RNA polymerase subunit H (RpoH/RPB5)